MSEQGTNYKALMGASAGATAASGGALALANGDISEGSELLNQGKEMVQPLFYDPENSGSTASGLKDYAVGNVDTLVHFLQGAGLSGLANKVSNPSTRAKGLAAGIASGAIGYSMLKEGMVEGAFETLDLGYESITNASEPVDYTINEFENVDLTADQKRDFKADATGSVFERSLYSDPNTTGTDILDEEIDEDDYSNLNSKRERGLGEIVTESTNSIHLPNSSEKDVLDGKIPEIDEDEFSELDPTVNGGSGFGNLFSDPSSHLSANESHSNYNAKGATAI